jgi:hypothetical protein
MKLVSHLNNFDFWNMFWDMKTFFGTQINETRSLRRAGQFWGARLFGLVACLAIAVGFCDLPAARAAEAVAVEPATAKPAERIEYNRDIRPILAENCFSCHGPDSAARKADLRLDQRDAAIETKAIVPGKPEASEAIQRIRSTEDDELMPPPSSHKKLTAAQKEMLYRWVAAGAEYQPHWSLIAPQRPAVPPVKQAAWVRNPIDAFVLAKLESLGLQPAEEADRYTLARRLSLDLRGVPPEPAEVEAFVNDTATDAYEKLVERFLASPQWGEHRGRYWLDAARYGDTHGIHIDNFREIWAYRDWVINAFNRNVPFDQFTIEQLAGDLLPNRSLEQQIASGFNRCNITTSEGGIIDEEYLVLYTRDRTETVAQVWLGMSAGCAVCHDHKFDPLTQREFYEMAAFFNNSTVAAKDGNGKEPPPTVVVPTAADRARWDALQGEVAAAKKSLDERKTAAKPEHDKWLATARPEGILASVPREGLRLHAPLSEGVGSRTAVAIDGQLHYAPLKKDTVWAPGHIDAQALKISADSVVEVSDVGDFERDKTFSVAAWIKFSKDKQTGPIVSRMDSRNAFRGWDLWLENGKLGSHIIHHWDDDALKVVSKTAMKPDVWQHVALVYDGHGKTPDIKLFVDGKLQQTTTKPNSLKNTIRTEAVFSIGQRFAGTRLDNLLVQDVRLYDRPLPVGQVAAIMNKTHLYGLLTKPADKRSPAEREELLVYYLTEHDKPYRDQNAVVAKLEKEQNDIKGRGTIAHVMQERTEAPEAYVLFRGEYDKRRDRVTPSTPKLLPSMPSDLPRDRFGFARWLLQADQPLTARVTVNRFWQELFGMGLVRTAGDFGVAGELPSHQDLLDWLALEFRDPQFSKAAPWDMKQFFRLLVTSATYRQAATVTPVKLERDPQNRFVSRGPRFRMDAEMVRDYALAASGLLVSKIGGPSVKPYQPDGVWEAVAMTGSNTRNYQQDKGESLYRRSMYTFWKRSAPPASMEIFNAPSRETCTVRRERTNTPLQALATLNDIQLVEAARNLAQRTLQAPATTDVARLEMMARRVLARPLRAEEQHIALASLQELSKHYAEHEAAAKELITFGESKPDAGLAPPTLAAWTMLANELMNLDEALNK